MRLAEALEYANIRSRKKKKDLGKLLWPDGSPESQEINISKLINGKTSRFKSEWIPIICKFCKVPPGFLWPGLDKF